MKSDDLRFYGDYAPLLQDLEETLYHEFGHILAKAPKEGTYSPTEHICSRIKSAASIQEKLKKHNLNPCIEQALKHLSDIVGLRAVTRFIGDVYTILKQIQQDSTWEIVKVKDYIANPKKNGYRSLHIIVRVPFPDHAFPTIQAEIQLRTIAMDCWASLEHQIKYKKHIPDAELISAELLRCADEMASTDLTMQTIREMIQRHSTDEGSDRA